MDHRADAATASRTRSAVAEVGAEKLDAAERLRARPGRQLGRSLLAAVEGPDASPRAARAAQRCEPIKPEAPVTRTCLRPS